MKVLGIALSRSGKASSIRRRSKRGCLLCPVLGAAILLTHVQAAGAHDARGLTYDPAIDLPITAAAGALTLGLRLGFAGSKSTFVQGPEEVTGIDTWAPQHQHAVYDKVSNVFLYGSMTGGLLAPTLAGVKNGQWWKNALLYGEALAVSMGITEVVKFAVRRPRPYTQDQRTGDISDDFSFFSGHAATTSVVLFFAARTIDLTYDLPFWQRLSLYLGATTITTTVSILRVAAGKHYPTDVIVGATVGASVGFLVPQLHQQQRVALGVAPIAEGGATLTLLGRY